MNKDTIRKMVDSLRVTPAEETSWHAKWRNGMLRYWIGQLKELDDAAQLQHD